MNIFKTTFLFIFIIFFNSAIAQPYFTRVDTVPVTENSNTLRFPWEGGLNFCQFSAIDLNQDGIKDLFVFDRTANKVNCFINKGTANKVDYVHAPIYQSQ